jgi:predicted DNA-binding transcriptional regulator YafY
MTQQQIRGRLVHAIQQERRVTIQYLDILRTVTPYSLDGDYLLGFVEEADKMRRFKIEFIREVVVITREV